MALSLSQFPRQWNQCNFQRLQLEGMYGNTHSCDPLDPDLKEADERYVVRVCTREHAEEIVEK